MGFILNRALKVDIINTQQVMGETFANAIITNLVDGRVYPATLNIGKMGDVVQQDKEFQRQLALYGKYLPSYVVGRPGAQAAAFQKPGVVTPQPVVPAFQKPEPISHNSADGVKLWGNPTSEMYIQEHEGIVWPANIKTANKLGFGVRLVPYPKINPNVKVTAPGALSPFVDTTKPESWYGHYYLDPSPGISLTQAVKTFADAASGNIPGLAADGYAIYQASATEGHTPRIPWKSLGPPINPIAAKVSGWALKEIGMCGEDIGGHWHTNCVEIPDRGFWCDDEEALEMYEVSGMMDIITSCIRNSPHTNDSLDGVNRYIEERLGLRSGF